MVGRGVCTPSRRGAGGEEPAVCPWLVLQLWSQLTGTQAAGWAGAMCTGAPWCWRMSEVSHQWPMQPASEVLACVQDTWPHMPLAICR